MATREFYSIEHVTNQGHDVSWFPTSSSSSRSGRRRRKTRRRRSSVELIHIRKVHNRFRTDKTAGIDCRWEPISLFFEAPAQLRRANPAELRGKRSLAFQPLLPVVVPHVVACAPSCYFHSVPSRVNSVCAFNGNPTLVFIFPLIITQVQETNIFHLSGP